MTITLHWWYVSIALFVIPIIYNMLRTPDYGPFGDWNLDGLMWIVVCWVSCFFFTIAKLF